MPVGRAVRAKLGKLLEVDGAGKVVREVGRASEVQTRDFETVHHQSVHHHHSMRVIAGSQLFRTPVVETRRIHHGISLVGTCKDEGLLLKIEISHNLTSEHGEWP